jgi:divinyl protochlorophyllide a 8-vinyl-reductase
MTHTPDPVGPPRIGPNSIIRVAEALRLQHSEAATKAIFEAAGLGRYLTQLPDTMVPEDEVIALYRAMRAALSPDATHAVVWEAGLRTGDYLLAHRIPKPAQAVLKVTPAGLAARTLLQAIGKHAWTFAGSGRFSADPAHPVRITIENCPTARDVRAEAPVCGFYSATFERIFSTLVSPKAKVREIACSAMGAPACVFEVRWR